MERGGFDSRVKPPAWSYASGNADFGNLTSNCYENGDAVVRLLFGEARSLVFRIRVFTSAAGVVCWYSKEGASSDGARARHGQARDPGYAADGSRGCLGGRLFCTALLINGASGSVSCRQGMF